MPAGHSGFTYRQEHLSLPGSGIIHEVGKAMIRKARIHRTRLYPVTGERFEAQLEIVYQEEGGTVGIHIKDPVKLLSTLGLDFWEHLTPGRECRVSGPKEAAVINFIGHITQDQWLHTL
jgi:hypothetical protein